MFWLGLTIVYCSIGLILASYSGTHLVFFMFLWPWAIAAQIVKQITGEYPSWTPPL